MLELDTLTKTFGKLTAVNKVSFTAKAGTVTGLIGPNGSGKTTLFNLISGFLKPTSGRVRFGGQDITGVRASRIAASGVIRTFQLTSIYRDMSVLEHVVAGHHLSRPGARRAGVKPVVGRTGSVRASAEAIIDFMGLSSVSDTPTHLLPGGTQRTLSIATALGARPNLLLLDEPLAGLTSTEKAVLAAKIVELRNAGLSVLLVEHDMKSVMSICDELCVINFGNKIGEGTPQDVMVNPAVIKAYLGGGE